LIELRDYSMHRTLHVLGCIVLLPYLALAAWFLLLGDLIATGSIVSMFGRLLQHATWLIPWGVLGFIAGFIALLAVGLNDRLRWLGGLCLFALAAGCLYIVIAGSRSPLGTGEWLFLLPCFAVLTCGAWLALQWRPRNGVGEHQGRR
jgi:hypothetical protein